MSQPEKKIVQYLGEAHAMELGLVRDLQAQIAMAPRDSYRSALQTHLRETLAACSCVWKRSVVVGTRFKRSWGWLRAP